MKVMKLLTSVIRDVTITPFVTQPLLREFCCSIEPQSIGLAARE